MFAALSSPLSDGKASAEQESSNASPRAASEFSPRPSTVTFSSCSPRVWEHVAQAKRIVRNDSVDSEDEAPAKRSRLDLDHASLAHTTFKDKAHQHPVYSLAVSPDGCTLVSGSVDKTVKMWDVRTETCLDTLRGHHSEYVSKVAYAPDGRSIVTGSFDRTACQFAPAQSSQPVFRWTQPSAVYSFAHDPRGQSLAFASGSTFCTRTGKRLADVPCGVHGKTVAYALDGKALAHDNPAQNELRVTDVAAGESRLLGKHADISCMAWAPQGDLLATSSLDNTVKIWTWDDAQQPQTDSHVATLNAHDDSVLCVAFSPDGAKLATGGRDERIHVYSVDDETVRLQHVIVGHTASVSSVVFSLDGSRLFSAAFDHDIKAWDLGAL